MCVLFFFVDFAIKDPAVRKLFRAVAFLVNIQSVSQKKKCEPTNSIGIAEIYTPASIEKFSFVSQTSNLGVVRFGCRTHCIDRQLGAVVFFVKGAQVESPIFAIKIDKSLSVLSTVSMRESQ